ncbi:MAG: TonB-dependent receptor [Bacteroidota bacterium]
MNKNLLYILIIIGSGILRAQAQVGARQDTSRVLDPVTISGQIVRPYLPDIQGLSIFAGKKTNSIQLDNGEANLPQNNARMIFSKIPGVNVWDMDGAGTQMNIGTRGTDAHRSIEMNMRQNGYNINSDMFGYPESHYTVPMQGVQQVQLVRGSAALQFGSQFGGMLNYVMKEGDSTKAFSLESEQTTGSYNFFNSYNAIGGTKGKVSYYAYYDNRHGDGWRPNAAFNYEAFYANIKYQFSSKGSLTFQFSRMDYRQQIAGGLTDAMFDANAQQSNRARNYFSPKINIPALILNYALSPKTRLQVSTYALWGERSSVQFINTANVNDTINKNIGSYNPRQVDRDYYKGFTTEARIMHQYQLGKTRGALAAGVRYFNQETLRKQKGVGTTGSDFDMTVFGSYGIDLTFHTTNYAAFVENLFQVTEKFSVTPGFRYEVVSSDLSGVIDNASYPVSYKGNRSFPLFGTGLQYQVTRTTQLYGNASQAYRPYLYASFTPATQTGKIDPDMKDSRGYDVDAGYRGQISDFINFDVNAFYLFYGDKIGKLTTTDSNGASYQLTTNIGNSVAKGFELYANISLLKMLAGNSPDSDVKLFSSISYTNARYETGALINNVENISIVGKAVEGVPDWINRSGLELRHKGITTTIQMSYVSRSFNDANNTVFSTTGLVGVIPSYTLFDWAFNYRFLKQYHFSAGVNNIADLRYYSRRINMYPGPGILPADGRTFYVSLGFKL